LARDKIYYALTFALFAVCLMLIMPSQSYAANYTNSSTPQFQATTTGPCIIPKSKDCPATSIAGQNIAGHIIACGYCQSACGLMCNDGSPSDTGEASSNSCTGTFVGGGSYSSSQTTYCNGGYDNSKTITLPSGSYSSYWCQDQPVSTTYGPGGGSSAYYDQGSCTITDYNTTTTHYDPYALNGQIVGGVQQSPVSQSPLVGNVLNDNTANALWLISCPASPGSVTNLFSSNLASFIGGNMCQTINTPLTSGAKVTTSITWNGYSPVTGKIANLTFTNAATGLISNLAYSGATNSVASTTFDISNGYNTESYIFQQVPAQAQQGVWAWDAKRADFSGFSPAALSLWQSYDSKSFNGGSDYTFVQNLEQNTGGTDYQWSCSYTYSLGLSLAIQSIQNANIPLASNGGSPVSVLPYLLYNISLPTTTSELNYAPANALLNLSLDLYSPHNFGSPAQNLDPFPFYTDAGFFAGQKASGDTSSSYLGVFSPGMLSVYSPDAKDLASPTTTLLSALTSTVAKSLGFDSGGATVGTYATGQLPSPTYITSSPNDFVYVLSTASSCGWFCFTSSTTTNLYAMRFIPQGDYNLSNYQPGSVAFTTDGATTWNNEWQTYWTNSAQQQSQNLYITSIYQLASSSSSFWGALGGDKAGQAKNMLPSAVASDYNNDVFVLGANTVCTAIPKPQGCQPVNGFSFNSFMVAAVFSNGVVQTPLTVNSIDNNFLPSDEFTASPGGQFLYLANVSYPGFVNIFETSDYKFAGNIPLSFTNSQYTMNVVAYLANGGPYNSPTIASAYQGQSLVADQAGNHHPVGITDSQGIIYVLDNWTVDVNGMHSAEMLLRAFSYNGIELPIQPTAANTVLLGSGYTYSGNIASDRMPPYGWVLSANVALSPTTSVSYCAAGCTYTPTSPQLSSASYLPIGPLVSPTGVVGPDLNDLGFTTDFNGTSYLVAHVFKPTSEGLLDQIYTTLFGATPAPLYSELLVFRPSLVNYTQVSLAAASPYVCYTDQNFGKASPCTYSSSFAQTVTQMYPPVMGVPSSFYYLESQGSPQQYLSLQNVVSSLFPEGVNCPPLGSDTSGSSPQCQQASTAASQINPEQVGSSLSNPITGAGTVTYQPNTYVNSVISGYVLIPYKITYNLQATVKGSDSFSDSGSIQGAVVAGTPPPNYYHCVQSRAGLKGGGTQCLKEEPACSYPVSGLTGSQAQGSVVQYAYARVNLPRSNSLNDTIEGGNTYTKFSPGDNYYIANVSDANLVSIPNLEISTFTNRLFGAVYINRTVSPGNLNSNGYTSPMVINSIQALNYQENYLVQQAGTSTYPGYSLQQSMAADPVNLNKVGPGCGSTCPSTYYYSTDPSKVFQGQSGFTYANYSQLNYISLFELIRQASQLYSTGFTTPEDSFIGYNRLIYTFVDRFNNAIYMPLGVDFANIAQIAPNPVVTVNALNANETDITVAGIATYTNTIGTYPLPAGSPVYVYYDNNMNFFNTTSLPDPAPSQTPGPYYKYALQCAFGTTGGGCPLADPLSSLSQGTSAPTIANTITFHTNYGTTAGECAPEPQSLLTTATPNQCNIYGNFGLPAVAYDSNIGNYQYCNPSTSTGNGILTSQMGLVAIVQTDANGAFTTDFNVCGTGAHKVLTEYYGSPGPQPFYVTQTPITQSAGKYELFTASNTNGATAGKTLEYGYVYAPNIVATDVQAGSYALGFGSVGIAALVAMVAIILGALFIGKRKPNSPKRVRTIRTARQPSRRR